MRDWAWRTFSNNDISSSGVSSSLPQNERKGVSASVTAEIKNFSTVADLGEGPGGPPPLFWLKKKRND